MPFPSTSLFSSLASLVNPAPRRRRMDSLTPPMTHVALECYETRVLPATSVFGVWQLTIQPPGTPPVGDPGPYTLEIQGGVTDFSKHGKLLKSGNNFGTVHIPGEGVVALTKLKVAKDGQSFKAKIKSPPIKGKIQGQLSENQNEIEATLKFLDKELKLSEEFKLKGPQQP
ncbi:MAG: hypothetical protein KDA68_10960 [Planctomycetaceae bacterium]|nr:hypothetical protein [Planctomycetaceae bacterium]